MLVPGPIEHGILSLPGMASIYETANAFLLWMHPFHVLITCCFHSRVRGLPRTVAVAMAQAHRHPLASYLCEFAQGWVLL